MTREDMPAVVKLLEDNVSHPLSIDQLEEIRRDKDSRMKVITINGEVCSFCWIYLRHDTIEVVTVVVSEKHRRRRFGTAVIATVVLLLKEDKRRYLIANVPGNNLESQKFFAACGMRARGTRRSTYREEDDVIEFHLDIGTPVRGYPFDGLHEGSDILLTDTNCVSHTGKLESLVSSPGACLHLSLVSGHKRILIPCDKISWIYEQRGVNHD